MGRHAAPLQQLEHPGRHPVVDNALANDGPPLLRVERRRVVLEVLNDEVRLVGRVHDLRLALVELAPDLDAH